MGCVSGLGVLAPDVQFRRPATLLPYRGVLRVGARNRAGPLGSGGRTFSSGTSLASPSVRSSFVLRDVRHSKSQICNDSTTERGLRSATDGCGHRGAVAWSPAVVCVGWGGCGFAKIAGGRPRADVSLAAGAVFDRTRVHGVFFADLDRGCRRGGRQNDGARGGTETPLKVAAFAS